MVELLTTVSNVITLTFLIAAAFAAIVQLRHVRAGNELQALIAIEERFTDPDLRRALVYVRHELADRLNDPGYRAELIARGYVDTRRHPEMAVCNAFNDVGTMIAGGFVREDIFFDTYGGLVESSWRLLTPVVALLRRERGSEQYAQFEYLAYRVERWTRAHPNGSYGAAAPRLPVDDPWLEADRPRPALLPPAPASMP